VAIPPSFPTSRSADLRRLDYHAQNGCLEAGPQRLILGASLVGPPVVEHPGLDAGEADAGHLGLDEVVGDGGRRSRIRILFILFRSEEHTSELQSRENL